jgi:hypothetical protein
MPNKAKFRVVQNEHKSLFHNNYQQRTTNKELLKTKPNKPKFQKPKNERNYSNTSIYQQ